MSSGAAGGQGTQERPATSRRLGRAWKTRPQHPPQESGSGATRTHTCHLTVHITVHITVHTAVAHVCVDTASWEYSKSKVAIREVYR